MDEELTHDRVRCEHCGFSHRRGPDAHTCMGCGLDGHLGPAGDCDVCLEKAEAGLDEEG